METENAETAQVILAEGADEVGLALMLQDLISQNLEQNPHKAVDFRRLKMGFGLTVTDAEVEMTMTFDDGCLTLYPGIHQSARVLIQLETEMVMAMSNLQIRGGLPYYFDETGWEVLKAILSRRIKIKGMFSHFPSMIRLTRVLSVN